MWWCGWLCLIFLCECSKSEPEKHRYIENGILNVELTIQNIPRQAKSYEIYKQSPFVTKSGSDERILEKSREFFKYCRETYGDLGIFSNNSSICSWKLPFGEVDLMRKTTVGNRNYSITSISVTKQHKIEIKMDWNNECNNIPPVKIDSSTSAEYVDPAAPVVKPAYWTDSGQNFAVFTCTAHCLPSEVLVWLQDTHLPTVWLVNQTYREKSDNRLIPMQITLNKTLEDADRNTSIFCGRREINFTEYPQMDLRVPDFAKNHVNSTTITLNFTRNIKTEMPKVTVKPDPVNFEPNSTVEIVCSASPVDGTILDWYEEDLISGSNRTLALKQTPTLSKSTMTSTLQLYVDEASLSKSIYCVLEHRFVYNHTPIYDSGVKSNKYDFRYREIARSKPIKLQTQNAGDTASKLVIAGACVVGALLFLLTGLLVRRCWRRLTSAEVGENDYAVPRVTYAVLSLPETDSKPPKKPDKQNYVEIVGAYKDKSKNK